MGKTVESCKKIVQDSHQLLGATSAGEGSETFYVGKQNAYVFVAMNVDFVELTGNEIALFFFFGYISDHFFGHKIRQH